jgi:5-methylcytosine-specific restriction endonuclease McrA
LAEAPSEKVKRWRKNTKRRIIAAMGGSCRHCGYDKCDEALECHHIDPTEKEFGFGAMRANPKSWERIVVELRKCVLLCANCHREVHAGLIPDNFVSSFNEEWIDYKHHEP